MSNSQLPEYAGQLEAFHRAFKYELRAIVHSLPLTPHMRVLDAGCGDGFYMGLIAERLVSPGAVIGLDVDPAFLEVAQRQCEKQKVTCKFEFIQGELAQASTKVSKCDLVWCAQSLYSLPEPVSALRQMAATVKPGGIVAVLENDTLHQILLPWPSDLELALRRAEMADFEQESDRPGKFYVGRRLPAVMAEAGIEPLHFRTQCIDRRAPLDENLREFLQSYLERLAERVGEHLQPAVRREFDELIDPASSRYLLRSPHFTMSWLNVLVWGRTR